MTVPLRVLLVEDSEDDALLTLLELRKGGFQTEWARVDTRPELERELAARPWDLLISDHRMPSFSSAGALDVLRKHGLDLPVIIVSGVAPEDLVTAAMRQGARDFISKGNLVRLVPAVQRELREAALRRDRQQIASRLEASETRSGFLALAVEQVVEAIAITDPDGRVAYLNGAFERLTGVAADQGRQQPLDGLLGQPGLAAALAQAAQGRSWEGRLSLTLAGREPQAVDASLSPMRTSGTQVQQVVAVLRDVTRETELERQLHQAQKMDALGMLAAGIAHDFNNVLTTILASAELIKCQVPGDSPLLPKVDAILHAGMCASGLTRQILGFSRKDEEQRLPLDLTVIVRDALHTLHGSIPDNVELQVDLMSGVWVEGDPAMIQQVVLNLAINALQAMQPEGGILQVALTEELAEPRSGMPAAGRAALLTVRDTGCGMSPEVQERLFEPFFTTKAPGSGTGLGLAMVHNTVRKAGGRIQVRSVPGQGSTFLVHLPLASGRPLPAAGERTAEGALAADAHGSESVLFVDDDPMTATLARRGLQSLGYRVASFTGAGDALEAFARQPDGFDLVFLDLTMPELDGMALAERIQALRPGLPIILVTGQNSAWTLPANAHVTFQGIVAKPFTPQDLGNALRKVLQARPAAAPAAGLEALHGSGARPAAKVGRPLILLAEDSRTTRSMIRSGLERAGYEIQEARDGLEAWELFTQAPHHRRFDLLLTDVVMPRMDGLELIQLVRKADPALPIGVFTSNEDKETVKSALHLGVGGFLNKPFERADLIDCVETLLAERSTRLDARRSLETAQAVRLAQRSMAAAPEQGVPLFTLFEPLTDAGGDVFRCFRCADGSILFVLADVAGHSVLSSYAVASFLGMLSNYVGECFGLMALPGQGEQEDVELACSRQGCGWYGHRPCDPLPHLALKLNHGIQSGPFAEVPVCTLLGLWNPATGWLQLLNAGIPHALHFRHGVGVAEPIRLNGTPLGVFPEAALDGATLQLEPGDRMLFGTDGFFEVQAPDRRPFQEVAPGHWEALAASPLDWSLNAICQAARGHGAGVIADDLLVMGFEQASTTRARDELVLRLPSTPRAIDLACDRLGDALKAYVPPGSPDAAGAAWAAVAAERRFDILIAVREALTNAVLHGNQNRLAAAVGLRCRPGPDGRSLVVSVTDEGPGFDLEAHRPPDDPLSERGRGIPLIRHHAQAVSMRGSALTMIFELDPPPMNA